MPKMSNNWTAASLEDVKNKRLNCSTRCHGGTFQRTSRSSSIFQHARSAGDAAASSRLTHRKDDRARRRHGTRQPSTLLRGEKSAFGVRGRRVETRPSQPSCDTNSAATRCSGGGGPRCCERPATWLAQVGRGAFTSVRTQKGGAIAAIHAGENVR